ncbi:MAG: polymer-forming cytoskeletal protein [Oscillospiraceae bacterium]|nr:polymer-forming cytoskeletal protein [Oscillospiraceae bacterium]
MADSVHISGAGNVGGGEYNNISISGSGEVTSDVRCQSFGSSGSMHIAGSVECSGEFKIAGSGRVDGDIKCGSCRLAGSAKVKSIEANGELKLAGGFNADGNVSGEKVTIVGAANINGLINGDEITISFDGDGIKANEIGGGTIKIAPKKEQKAYWFRKKKIKHSEIGTIEGDEISLELVKADVVRGANVTIGDGCEIGKVEYSESLEISENANVDHQVKI